MTSSYAIACAEVQRIIDTPPSTSIHTMNAIYEHVGVTDDADRIVAAHSNLDGAFDAVRQYAEGVINQDTLVAELRRILA